jgi:type IV secretion system protein VirB9
LRRYSFDLRALQATGPTDPSIIYSVRFNYPQAPMVQAAAPRETPRATAPRPLNTRYSTRGSDRFEGVRVFDDGVMTYFQIPADVETPAIFVLDHRGDEELVNTQTQAPYVVVHQLARGFVLRSGRHKARVTNDGYGRMRAASPATEGPTP